MHVYATNIYKHVLVMLGLLFQLGVAFLFGHSEATGRRADQSPSQPLVHTPNREVPLPPTASCPARLKAWVGW